MKQLVAILVAAAFASTAIAQSKDVTTKSGGSTNATTKDVKEKPKHPAPKLPQAKKKEPKQPGGNVTTKRGENVTDKKGAAAKSGMK